jgi:hypothetical protein
VWGNFEIPKFSGQYDVAPMANHREYYKKGSGDFP